MTGMVLRIFDVEHGACAMLAGPNDAIAMIDCGHNSTTGWRPSNFIRNKIQRAHLDNLLITNVDQDHLSDLSTLIQSGVTIGSLYSNKRVTPEQLRSIKLQCGPLTADAEAYLQMTTNFGPPGSGRPFSQTMGGIDVVSFTHPYPTFTDTNNLSAVYFIKFGPFKIIFPGDIEKAAWRLHLQNPAFVAELRTTTILVASHHGRENGFCPEAFQDLKFQAVIISDKSIVHGTQEIVPDYRAIVREEGVVTTSEPRRHVLTTRRDKDILFQVNLDGNYTVTTNAQ